VKKEVIDGFDGSTTAQRGIGYRSTMEFNELQPSKTPCPSYQASHPLQKLFRNYTLVVTL